jgi:hypothetical protein
MKLSPHIGQGASNVPIGSLISWFRTSRRRSTLMTAMPTSAERISPHHLRTHGRGQLGRLAKTSQMSYNPASSQGREQSTPLGVDTRSLGAPQFGTVVDNCSCWRLRLMCDLICRSRRQADQLEGRARCQTARPLLTVAVTCVSSLSPPGASQ